MRAVIESGGKQYTVSPGETIRVERLGAAVGDEITLDKVLMVDRDGQRLWGQPYVAGASVTTEVTAQKRARKVVVFKFKRRKGYHRTHGHRQPYTELEVKDIKTE